MSQPEVLLITGGNTGLGYETVKALIQSDKKYRIIIGGRNPTKVAEAIEKLKGEVPNTHSTLEAVTVDIESDESIQAAYDDVSKKVDRIDILLNNAGGDFSLSVAQGKMSVRESWNKAYDLNVTGTHIFTHTFMPLLFKSASPRLLFIASGTSSLTEVYDATMSNGPIHPINHSPEAGWPKGDKPRAVTSYRSSKAGLNMMFLEWARVLKNDNVKVHCVSPGFLATGLGAAGPEALKKMGALDPSIGGNFVKDVVQGKRDADVNRVVRSNMNQPW